ncbi:MAG: ABC transporter ATP-binding protein [Thermoplasmata archaeon]|nr:ABC transporter ATP-binding protein [Thermoplasmata archaeon]
MPATGSTDVPAIEVRNLTKKYGEVVAVNGLNLKVKKGEVYGFLGPNGAGKTTTLKIIMGLVHPTAGDVLIGGKKPDAEVRRDIGFLPEKMSFYDNLTPTQTLEFFADLKNAEKKEIRQILRDVGLQEAAERRVGGFSKGMGQLLGIAQCMLGSPSLYVLDEPMSGLDARWRKYFKDKLKTINQNGATIIFSSHILAEVEDICDRVGIIHRGRLLFEGTVQELHRHLKLKPKLEIMIEGLAGKVPEELKGMEGIEASASGDWLTVVCDYGSRAAVMSILERKGLKILDFRTSEPSLEESFDLLLASVEGRR